MSKAPGPESEETPVEAGKNSASGLFGTSNLPMRNLRLRKLGGSFSWAAFLMIATVVGTLLGGLILIIAEDATVPPSDIGGEDGVERPASYDPLRTSNDVARTQAKWNVETWNPTWEDLPSSDERLDRSQIRIEATWEDTSYRATNGDGDLYTSPTLGIASYDLEEDLRDELCARNLAGLTYEAHERWSMLDWTPDQLEYTPLDVRGRLTVWNRTSEPNSQIGDYWIEPQQDGGFEKRKWNGMYWEDLTPAQVTFVERVEAYAAWYNATYSNASTSLDRNPWSNGMVRLEYVPPSEDPNAQDPGPLIRTYGDLWFNTTYEDRTWTFPEDQDRDSSTVQAEADLHLPSDVAFYVEDPLMGSAWVDVPEELEDLLFSDRVLKQPNVEIEPEYLSFCTEEDAVAYIREVGMEGSAKVREHRDDSKYLIESTGSTKRSAHLWISVSDADLAESSITVRINTSNGGASFDRHRFVPGEGFVTTPIDANCTSRENPFRSTDATYADHPCPILRRSGSSGSQFHWLYLEHELNHTVVFDHVEGAARDATDEGYIEVGGSMLWETNFAGFTTSRFLSTSDGLSHDNDGDGLPNACDPDIDEDLLANPIIGGHVDCLTDVPMLDMRDPANRALTGVTEPELRALGVPAYELVNLTSPGGLWAFEDANFDGINDRWLIDIDGLSSMADGVHDQVEDHDVDGDGKRNLVDGQGCGFEDIVRHADAQAEELAITEWARHHPILYNPDDVLAAWWAEGSPRCSTEHRVVDEDIRITNATLDDVQHLDATSGVLLNISELALPVDAIGRVFCSSEHKVDFPAVAEADCDRVVALHDWMSQTPISAAVGDEAIKRHYCTEMRQLSQVKWVQHCGAPTYLEDFGTSEFGPAGGTDHAIEGAMMLRPWPSMIGLIGAAIAFLLVRHPAPVVLPLRSLIRRIDGMDEVSKEIEKGEDVVIHAAEAVLTAARRVIEVDGIVTDSESGYLQALEDALPPEGISTADLRVTLDRAGKADGRLGVDENATIREILNALQSSNEVEGPVHPDEADAVPDAVRTPRTRDIAIFLPEASRKLTGLLMLVILTGLGFYLAMRVFSTDYPLLRPFMLVFGLTMMLVGGLGAWLRTREIILHLRPEVGGSTSEAIIELGFFLGGIATWLYAIHLILGRGMLIGGVLYLLILSGVRRLVGAAQQISRVPVVKEDRIPLSVQGREGWMMIGGVALVVGVLTIPFQFNIPFVFTNWPGTEPFSVGMRMAFWGSIYVILYAMLFTIPVSIGAAIWLEEYAPKSGWMGRFRSGVQMLITNLAGVPSIVFGLFGLAMFVNGEGWGMGLASTMLTAGLTLATMAMPVIVLASQEALRAVPPSLRSAAFGMGCTKWQVTKDHVLPYAIPGMMTGTILAMSRILGEAAPLIVIGAVGFGQFESDPFYYVEYGGVAALDALIHALPNVLIHDMSVGNLPLWGDRGPAPLGPFSADPSEFAEAGNNLNGRYSVMPYQIFHWAGQPQAGFKVAAAAGIVVLMLTLITVNLAAILIRQYFRGQRT